ncbi:ATP-binding cassette domain-containing protein [Rathayibacter tanaceti]|uniref:ATP-binding cassette domain-containing protein n=1 Tax=Rathayibacter tanaceti TaxID=1671680 RepID=A0AAE6RMK8_9MICO|nr:ATP-binding cassette domain-containing protein [Rathayibacter tanaceti]
MRRAGRARPLARRRLAHGRQHRLLGAAGDPGGPRRERARRLLHRWHPAPAPHDHRGTRGRRVRDGWGDLPDDAAQCTRESRHHRHHLGRERRGRRRHRLLRSLGRRGLGDRGRRGSRHGAAHREPRRGRRSDRRAPDPDRHRGRGDVPERDRLRADARGLRGRAGVAALAERESQLGRVVERAAADTVDARARAARPAARRQALGAPARRRVSKRPRRRRAPQPAGIARGRSRARRRRDRRDGADRVRRVRLRSDRAPPAAERPLAPDALRPRRSGGRPRRRSARAARRRRRVLGRPLPGRSRHGRSRRPVPALAPRPPQSHRRFPVTAPHTLSADAVTLAYNERVVVDGLSLTVPTGAISVIVGANACGKSTLLRAMARLITPRNGAVLLDGQAIHRLPTRQVAQQVGLLPQTPIAPEGIAVSDLVARGRYPHRGFLGRGSGTDDDAIVEDALRATGTLELADRPVDELSGGQRQRVWIAMALAQRTDVLLLDEPTTYLDVSHQVEVLDLLTDLNRSRGTTIVIVLHDLNLAARYADHLFAVRAGALYASGAPAEVVTPETVRAVFGMESRVIEDPVSRTPLVLPIGRHHSR